MATAMISKPLSPAQATVGPLLSKIRRGDMAVVHSLRRGAAEALEVVVHGDARIVDRPLDDQTPPAVRPMSRAGTSCAPARP